MKQILAIVLVAIFLVLLCFCHATQKITIKVEAINEISVSGDPETFLISEDKSSIVDSSTTYAITTNQTNKKIVAKIDKELPKGLTLKVQLDPPEGATSNEVALSTTQQDGILGMGPVAAKDMKIHYTLIVDEKPEIAESSVNVVFTIVYN